MNPQLPVIRMEEYLLPLWNILEEDKDSCWDVWGQILSAVVVEQLTVNSYFKCKVGITSLRVKSSDFKTITRMSHITTHGLSLETLGISFGEGWCRQRPALLCVPIIPALEKL